MENFKKMTLWQKVYGTYFKPVQVFENLKEKGRGNILLPFLLLLLGHPLFYLIRFPAYSDFVELNSGQSDPQVLKRLVIMGIILQGVKLVAGWFVGSILMFGFAKLSGGEGTFRQLLSTNGFAFLPIILMLIIMTVIGPFKGELLINFSPAVFIPHLKGTLLYGIARFFCAFFVWENVLMVIGYCKITNSSRAKSIFIVCVVALIQLFVNLPGLRNL